MSITRALGDQLADALLDLEPEELTRSNLGLLPDRAGVYQLYRQGKLVYIGKADASVPHRLTQHHRKISGRQHIDVSDMRFTALFVDEDFQAVAPETLLINRHRSAGEIPWNVNGFGNKDPGRQRDKSAISSNHFDYLFPIDLDIECASVLAGNHRVGDILMRAKSDLPYTFRYQGGGRARSGQPPAFWNTDIEIFQSSPSADELFDEIAAALPGWQVTALHGYVIMYEEREQHYPSPLRVYRY